MSNLTRNTILQRVPYLKLDLDSTNKTRIFLDGKLFEFGVHALKILDTFSHPTSVSEALKKLQTQITGAQDWMDLMSTIVHLHEAGALQDEAQNKPTLRTDTSGYDSAPIHVAMLNDRLRTSSFLAGIHEVVHPGDVVLDIGTGTGILAIAAARAGARHVYAIEASGIGKSAKTIFEANGLADRITLIEGWSTQINLPEHADVLISEIIGNEPLGERVLETTVDALKRLLKPNARLLPNRVKIFGLPIAIPQTELIKHTFAAETLQNWKSWYGIDFSPLIDITRNSPQTFYINPSLASDWKTLCKPVLLADVDFNDVSQLTIDNTMSVTTNASGELNGVLIYFELELGPTTRLSTHPEKADNDCSWRSPVWTFTDPLLLQTGDKFTVTYKYRLTEDQFRLSVGRA